MKLTTQKLKKLIAEELGKINEMGSYMGRSPEEIKAEMASIKAQIEKLKDPEVIRQLRDYLDGLLVDLSDAM